MAEKTGNYSNAHLAQKVQAALRPFDAPVVSLKLKHQATVQQFVNRVEETYRRSQATPVRLRRD